MRGDEGERTERGAEPESAGAPDYADGLAYLDELAETAADGRSDAPPLDYIARLPDSSDGDGGVPAPPRPGRPVPPPMPIVRRAPQSNRLGPVALFCGVVALLLGIAVPWFVLLIIITAGGGLIVGGMTVQHSVNTGAPGKWLGLAGMLTGAAGAVLMVIGIIDASNTVRDLGGGLSGLMSELDAMSAAAEVTALELPGTGQAEITLDSTVIELPLDGCGFEAPAVGLVLAGHGRQYEGQTAGVSFSSKRLGESRDIVVVDAGPSTFFLQAEDGLFEVSDGQVRVEGAFREAGSNATVAGRLVATCTR